MGVKEGWIGHKGESNGMCRAASEEWRARKSAVSGGEGARDHRILVKCSGQQPSEVPLQSAGAFIVLLLLLSHFSHVRLCTTP